MITHNIKMYFHKTGPRKSFAFQGCKIHISQIMDIPAHIPLITFVRNHIKSIQNILISRNAVGLDILAKAKKNPDITRYFILSLVSSLCSAIYLIKIIQDKIASVVIAITPRSVLLSTKTKKAHIQLLSHKSNIIQPDTKDRFFAFSDNSKSFIFVLKYSITSFTNPNPNISTNIPLKKFIATANVSGANRVFTLPNKLNQKVMNTCRSKGAAEAIQTFHRSTQWLAAKTLGSYI